jgi:hypothetical protein
MRLLRPIKGSVFKIGWRQAYPALALEKHDALHFRVSAFDSDWMTLSRGEFFGSFGSSAAGMKIDAISGPFSLLAPRLSHTLRPHYGAI